jgi:hypothetical protein
MHLIQLLLPLYDNNQNHFPGELYDEVRTELTERFGGLTAYMRAPAEGLWKEDSSNTVRDEIVIYEVMAENLDREWWHEYRLGLQEQFVQESLIIRATPFERL